MFSAPCDFVSTAPYSYKFGPSSGTALLTMTVADYSRQALLRQCCCIEVRESSSGKNAFFPTMYLLHLHLGFRVASGFILFGRLTHLRMPYAVSVRQVSGLPPASFRSRLAADTLALGYVLGATPCTRDFHPLERAHAERTNKKPRWFTGPSGFRFAAKKYPHQSIRVISSGCKKATGLSVTFKRCRDSNFLEAN